MPRAASAVLAGSSVLALATAATVLAGGPLSSRSLAQARERIAYVSVVRADTLAPLDEVSPEMIAIREDGVAREILQVARADSEMPIALVLDNSQEAAPTIPDLRQAVETFVQVVDGLGPVALFTVGDRPTLLQTYTRSREELVNASKRLFHAPGSGATLLDAIAEVSRGLERRPADRAALVVVTGENTDFSNLHYQDALEALEESGAMLSAVVLTNPNASQLDERSRNRAIVLERGPRESGGIRLDVLTSMSFDERLADVGRALASQYRVVYARPDTLIPPERFEVSAARPGLRAFGAPARNQENP